MRRDDRERDGAVDTEALLAAYAHDRGALSAEEQYRVEMYLSVSADARREVEAIRAAVDRVRESEAGVEEPAWNDMARAIARAVDAAAAQREREAGSLGGWLRRLWRPRWVLAAVAVAAAAIALAVWRGRPAHDDGDGSGVAIGDRVPGELVDAAAAPGPREDRAAADREVVELDDIADEEAIAALEDQGLRAVVVGLAAGIDGEERGDDPDEEDLGSLLAAPVLDEDDVAALLGDEDDGAPRYTDGAHLDVFPELDYDGMLADLDDAQLDALDALLAAATTRLPG